MTRNISACVLFFCLCFVSCRNATPEKSFDVAVLNSNLMIGFANDGLWRDLQSPSVKMGNTKEETITMQRQEVIDDKVKFTEENLVKLKSLPRTDDTKDIIDASMALHQYILPVYKNEYTQLARDFDKRIPMEILEQEEQAIREKHFSTFEALYNRLMVSGKAYAARHHIQVRWAM